MDRRTSYVPCMEEDAASVVSLYIYSHREALKGGKEVEERGRRRKREESGKEGIRALN